MSMEQSNKVKLAIVGFVALLAVGFAVYMILPSGESGPSPADLEAAQKAQELVQAAEEATNSGKGSQPAPPVQLKSGGFGPSSGQ